MGPARVHVEYAWACPAFPTRPCHASVCGLYRPLTLDPCPTSVSSSRSETLLPPTTFLPFPPSRRCLRPATSGMVRLSPRGKQRHGVCPGLQEDDQETLAQNALLFACPCSAPCCWPPPLGLCPLSRPPSLTSLFSVLSFPSTVYLRLHSSVPLIGHLPPLLSDWPASFHHPICLLDSPCLPVVMYVMALYQPQSPVRHQTVLSLCLLSPCPLPSSFCLPSLSPHARLSARVSPGALLASSSLILLPPPPASLSVCLSLRL